MSVSIKFISRFVLSFIFFIGCSKEILFVLSVSLYIYLAFSVEVSNFIPDMSNGTRTTIPPTMSESTPSTRDPGSSLESMTPSVSRRTTTQNPSSTKSAASSTTRWNPSHQTREKDSKGSSSTTQIDGPVTTDMFEYDKNNRGTVELLVEDFTCNSGTKFQFCSTFGYDYGLLVPTFYKITSDYVYGRSFELPEPRNFRERILFENRCGSRKVFKFVTEQHIE